MGETDRSGGALPQATFVTLAVPGGVARQALLQARSIRAFAGALADEPIMALVPDGGPRMARAVATAFENLGVRLVPFPIEPEIRRIPFAVKAVGGARAEALVQTDRLIWLDPDALVVNDASEFLIPTRSALGWRPVHHRLIGLEDGQPVEGMWRVVLEACDVPEARLFRMFTNLGERIRAYFNAGVFVVDPERGLLRHWLEALVPLARDPAVTAFTNKDALHATFLHQVVWTATLLALLGRGDMEELSPAVNYPLNLQEEIPAGRRAISLQRLTVIRTEDIFSDPEWRHRFPILGPLEGWLTSQPLTAVT